MKYCLSLRFSAIQKAILRHHRLWSIAGTSDLLAQINEIYLPQLCTEKNGFPIISAGGKFTAVFENEQAAISAADSIKKLISTEMPFLEVQYSGPKKAEKLVDALFPESEPGLLADLSEQKRCFRGYAYTYNPYLKTCDECSEYPAEENWVGGGHICRFCKGSYQRASLNLKDLINKDESKLTSIKLVYKRFAERMHHKRDIQIPRNFNNLFSSERDDATNRIAVWASDINNMGDKLPLWLRLDEHDIYKIFDTIRKLNIDVIIEALVNTFGDNAVRSENETGETQTFLPFRIIVAGGDDLCIVTDSHYIVKFAIELSKAFRKCVEDSVGSNREHPLNEKFLLSLADKLKLRVTIKRHSFGGAFVVAPLHAPFQLLHSAVEGLMKIAKEKTDRKENSVNWRILAAEEQPTSEALLPFDKPLFIDSFPESYSGLTFAKYCELAEKYRGLSNAQRQKIVSTMIELIQKFGRTSKANSELDMFLKRTPEAFRGPDSVINKLLLDKNLKEEDSVSIARLCTLFEIMELTGDRR
ncbi:MAG: hypothetical protein QXZ09_08770 [Candidatus Methanomethylicaceae archaeon]